MMTSYTVPLEWREWADPATNSPLQYDARYGKFTARITIGMNYGQIAYKTEIWTKDKRVSALSDTLDTAKEWAATRIWNSVYKGQSLEKSDEEWAVENVRSLRNSSIYYAQNGRSY